MPRKTDSNSPEDWLWIAASDLELVQAASMLEVGFSAAHSKLAEIVEKIVKAELIHTGWRLEKTHDLERLLEALVVRQSNLAAEVGPLCDALAETT